MQSRGKLMVSLVTSQKNDDVSIPLSDSTETREEFALIENDVTEVPHTTIVDHYQMTSTNFTVVDNVEFQFLEVSPSNTTGSHATKKGQFADSDGFELTSNEVTSPQDFLGASALDQPLLRSMSFEEIAEDILENNLSEMNEIAQNQETLVPNSDEISDDSDIGIALVPYSDTSASDSDSDYPEKSKKRRKRWQVNKADWFAEKNKIRRERGQSYLGRLKTENKWSYEKPKEPRKMNERCRCQSKENGLMKCATINENDRKSMFEHFWKQLTWGEKKVYVNNTVTILPTQRHRDRKERNKSRRSQSMSYHLRIDDNNVRVCKTMFLNTLGIGRCTVLNWKNNFKVGKASSILRDFKDDCVKPDSDQKEMLNKFLDSLPVMDSHYCRASSNKKYLLPEWSSKQSLYNFYVTDWCKSHSIEPLSRTSFNRAFDLRNMAVFKPKKDQCEKCAGYKVGAVPEEEYQLHIARKEEARLEKEKDKKTQSFVFTADMQSVLMAPKSQVCSLYYRTKLQVHNMCFYNLINNDGFCFLWNETEGGVNAEEFASIWIYFLQEKLLSSIENGTNNTNNKEIIIYSDGCGYQNRNAIIANSLLNLAITQGIIIVQKYLEVGHTQMEADSMHSTIERCLRKKVINVPAEYIKYCRTARRNPKPYDVTYLNHSFFRKFSDVMAYKSIRPGRAKGDSKVTDIRAIKYTPEGNIFYKKMFSDDWSLLPQRKAGITNKQWTELQLLHENRLPIKTRKYEDLQHIKRTLPTDYHEFYDNLPYA